ncbi:G patch domain-containing protein 1 homolog [Belonocnema kinseyi]|uniref:G patch domain-containing protein 1 homolog n=1 Tax=Belonocnema kinseyi TaxID=2817044 RepID=UPI00143CC6B9|nr:G patch domain-containing protein 1 homolog [Belonocnema kinseyi]
MHDSDEENYVKYGTPLDPLDEDSLPRKKPITLQDQVAVDEYGRRRFHGAFTGGFSAGYFNSVGTRDGWKPQQFKSSRASKAGGINQRPEDFMDEEDTSEFGFAPTGIRATQDYTDDNKRGTKRERARQINDGPIPGIPVLHQILQPTRERVGVRLLKKMGWKPGQGVGPRLTKKEKVKMKEKNEKLKVYGCYMPSQRQSEESESDVSDDEYSEIMLAPDDYEPLRAKPKDNYFGLGYSGLDKRPILSSHINLFEPSTFSLQEKNKKFSIKGQAFGVGAFEEEDEDIYAKEDMSNYDFVLGPKKQSKSRWNRDEEGNSSKVPGCLEGFVPAKNPIERRKIYKPPELPKDFKPIHVPRKSRFFPPIECPARSSLPSGRRKLYGGQNLNANTRASIIGEPSVSRIAESASKAEEGRKEESCSVASKIIMKTLNLHGKEQVAERQKLEEERKIGAVISNSWMDKLYTASFVKGGVVGSGLSVEGSLKNLNEFKEKTETSGASSKVSDPGNPAGSGDFAKPFIADPDKQRRFEQYLVFRKSNETRKLATIQPLSMTEWDRNQETVEFQQAARLFDSSLHASENKFVSSGALKTSSTFAEPVGVDEQMREAARIKMFGKLTRVTTIWQPSSLVCKRFNVAEPRVGCALEEKKKKKYSVFESLDFCNAEAKFERGTEEKREFRGETRVEMLNLEEEKMTEKEKSFEATYCKVFGKGEEEKSGDLELKKEVESGENLEEKRRDTVEEKKDLFKAIFLSSSEDSDSEVDESLDSEVVKSVLIGKTSEVNLQRNTSPPRGIFANVDLDSLVAPVERSDKSEDVEASGSQSESRNADANEKVKEEAEVVCVDVLPPDAYGPLPPSRVPKIESRAEEDPEMAKPVFRSVAMPKIASKSEIEGEWVERTRVKKSKKEKKKHKHKERDRDKERSKHKKKSKKSKK